MDRLEALAMPAHQAFAALGVGRTTGFKLIADGKLTALKLGGKTIITLGEMRRFLDSLPKVRG